MFYLDLAMKLKRTLVLPRTRLLRKARHGFNFDPNADYVGWGELYNVSTLSRLHPVMELDQYVALHGEQVTLHVNNNNQLCKAESKGATQVDYNGRLFDAEYSICSKGLQYETNRLLSHQFTGEESIAFGNSVDQLGMESALTLRPWVRFEQEIYDKAAAYVKKTFRGAPFLSIHWRRTDFLQVRRSQPGVLQSAEMLISHAKRLMKRHGLKHVYLATDCDDADALSMVEGAQAGALHAGLHTRDDLTAEAHAGGECRDRDCCDGRLLLGHADLILHTGDHGGARGHLWQVEGHGRRDARRPVEGRAVSSGREVSIEVRESAG